MGPATRQAVNTASKPNPCVGPGLEFPRPIHLDYDCFQPVITLAAVLDLLLSIH